jgi:hypothetical protein
VDALRALLPFILSFYNPLVLSLSKHPLSFILYPLSFFLYPLSSILEPLSLLSHAGGGGPLERAGGGLCNPGFPSPLPAFGSVDFSYKNDDCHTPEYIDIFETV